MAKIYGIDASDIVPQSDFSASQNENLGWTARQSFLVIKGGVDNSAIASKFPIGARLGNLDPNCDEFYSRMWLTSISSVQTVEGGYTMITAEFSGFTTGTTASPNKDTSPTFYKRGVLVDQDLSHHHKWRALADDQKFALGLLVNGDAISKEDFTSVGTYDEEGKWSPWQKSDGTNITLTGDSIEFAKLIAQGQTTYKYASYEYTHRWDSNVAIPSGDMNDLGKITTPSGSPPTPGTGRNWMLAGVNEEQHGAGDYRYSCELVYVLSDQQGFSTFLYT